MKRSLIGLLWLTFFLSRALAADVTTEVTDFLTLSDGIKLSAKFYFPSDLSKKYSVVFSYTPYGCAVLDPRGKYFSENNFIFVCVETRGRGESDGQFEPFLDDKQDGAQVVEILAAMPWSTGRVGMWGGSYLGTTQWSIASELPPSLKTIVPVAAAYPGVDFPNERSIFRPYSLQWLNFVKGKKSDGKFRDNKFWQEKFSELFIKGLAFEKLDEVCGIMGTVFQDWISHPFFDDYWKMRSARVENFKDLKIPILTITGYYDGDQKGAMTYYREMERVSFAESLEHYLVIGPWDHPGTRTPKRVLGGVDFGENSELNLNELHRQWYEYTLNGGTKPDFLKKKVAYYPISQYEWVYKDSLNELSALESVMMLPKSGRLSSVYIYDPKQLKGISRELNPPENWLTDYSYVEDPYNPHVIVESAPLPRDRWVSGFVEVEAYIKMNVLDTDLNVNLYEVKQNGEHFYLSGDSSRARYRSGENKEVLVTPGKLEKYEFKNFAFFSKKISKGSRLRLVFSSPNSIYYQKNFNSGNHLNQDTLQNSKRATIELFHSKKFPLLLKTPFEN